MIQFRRALAASSAVACGMLFGIYMIAIQGGAFFHGTPSPGQRVLGIGIGLFFGGGMALPLAFSNFVAACIAVWITRGSSFRTQFTAFAVLGLPIYFTIMHWLNDATRTIGGVMPDREAELQNLIFYGASLVMAWLLMALASRQTPKPRDPFF